MSTANDRFLPEPPVPVRPPTLPPDFPDIPQNPSSGLHPPPAPSATPDKISGTARYPETLGQARRADGLRDRNQRLRDRINEILEAHTELRDAADEIALYQGLHVVAGTPFLERIHGQLQERARAIIERRPDLEPFFDV